MAMERIRDVCENSKKEGKAWCGVFLCFYCSEDLEALKEMQDWVEAQPGTWPKRGMAAVFVASAIRQMGG